ncbi:hypothetical protein ACFLZZ_00045 [Nanoarchaeota archaeon]
MKNEKKGKNQKKKPEKKDEAQEASLLPIVASARTGLAGKDDALLRRVPAEYGKKKVKEILDYLVGQTSYNEQELPYVESLKKEMEKGGSVVLVNGHDAKYTDGIEKYLVEQEHELPDGSKKKYRQLEIEVSAVQEGGYNTLEGRLFSLH